MKWEVAAGVVAASLLGCKQPTLPSVEALEDQMSPRDRVLHARRVQLSGCRRIEVTVRPLRCVRRPANSVRVWIETGEDGFFVARHQGQVLATATSTLMAGWSYVDVNREAILDLATFPGDWKIQVKIEDETATPKPPFPELAQEPDQDLIRQADRLAYWGNPRRRDELPPELQGKQSDFLERAADLYAQACEPSLVARTLSWNIYGLSRAANHRRALASATVDIQLPIASVEDALELYQLQALTLRENGHLHAGAHLIPKGQSLIGLTQQLPYRAMVEVEHLLLYEGLDEVSAADSSARLLLEMVPSLSPAFAAHVLARIAWTRYLRATSCRRGSERRCDWRWLAGASLEHSRRALSLGVMQRHDTAETALNLGLAASLLRDESALEEARTIIGDNGEPLHGDWLTWHELLRQLKQANNAAIVKRLAKLAQTTQDDELGFRADVSLADHYLSNKDFERAITHYRSAEARITRWLKTFPLGKSRFGLRQRLQEAHSRLVDSLVSLKRTASAFEAARRARRSALLETSSPLQPVRKKLNWCRRRAEPNRSTLNTAPSSTELSTSTRRLLPDPSDKPNQARLMVWGSQGVGHAFLSIGQRTYHEVIDSHMPGKAAVQSAVESFWPLIQKAKSLLFLPTRRSRSCPDSVCAPTPVHMLRVGRKRRPLWTQLPVAEKLDIPVRASNDSPKKLGIIFADGFSKDLSRTSKVLETGVGELRNRGFDIQSYRKLADLDAFDRALTGSQVFAFFGHGLEAADGHRLQLGPDLSIGALELLALKGPAPREVILLGCATGRSSGLSGEVEVGPAQAFLMLGARSVIATRGPIEEDAAARFAACWGASRAGSGTARFQQALEMCASLGEKLADFFVMVQ